MTARHARRTVVSLAAACLASTLATAQPSPLDTELDFHADDPALRSYVLEAVARNPRVLEARARFPRRTAARAASSRITEPRCSASRRRSAAWRRASVPQMNTVMLTQAFPWFGTLDLRGRVALQQAAAQFHLYQATRRDVVAEVKQAFYNLAYVDAALGLADEEASLLEHYEALAENTLRDRAGSATGRHQAPGGDHAGHQPALPAEPAAADPGRTPQYHARPTRGGPDSGRPPGATSDPGGRTGGPLPGRGTSIERSSAPRGPR